MKAIAAFAVLLTLGAGAMAKPAPVERQRVAISPDDLAIQIEPAGATLEANYFHAPQQPFAAGRVFPCRMQLRVFEKMRLAQTCN